MKRFQHQLQNTWKYLTITLLSFMSLGPVHSALASKYILKLHFRKEKTKQITIPFRLVHNLVIIPGFINGSDTLNFILDSGVSNTLITSLEGVDKIPFNLTRKIKLHGLGVGQEIDAFHSYGNTLQLPGVIGYNQGIIILSEDLKHISQGLGMPINGLIGYDVFENFVVEIDYQNEKLVLYDQEFYERRKQKRKRKRGDVVPIEIVRNKPYVITEIQEGDKKIDLRLMVDSGASHALSLFRSSVDHFPLPENSLYTYIGIGLNGEIYGNICRQDLLKLGQQDLFDPLVTLPDEAAIEGKVALDDRHGSLGAETLKRFTVIFDYRSGEMILKRNAYFKHDFKYNLSGMDVITPVPGIRYYEITKVRHGSPAWTAGLEEGDQILAINGIDTKHYSLARLINILQSKPGRKLSIKVKREEEYLGAKFRLKDPIN